MKKLILIVGCALLLPVQLQAQKGVRGWRQIFVPRSAVRAPGARSVAPVLDARATTSVAVAAQTRKQLAQAGANVPRYVPAERTFLDDKDLLRMQQLHPQSYLQGKPKQVIFKNNENYLTAEHNRRYIGYAHSIQQRLPRVAQIMEQLQTTVRVPQAGENPARWLAGQVPADTRVLAIGQGFYFNPAVVDATEEFLVALRQQMPQRDIIVLTSFLEDGTEWSPQLESSITTDNYLYRKGYEPLWQSAHAQQIQVIGMEKSDIFRKFTGSLEGTDSNGVPSDAFWEYTLEAAAMRAQLFEKNVKKYQQLYPDALIVLYVEQAQASFNFPFSAVNKLPEEGLYAVGIVSKTTPKLRANGFMFPGEEEQKLSTRTTLFEQMYAQAQLPQAGAVARGLAKDVGSDSWIKIEYNPEKQDHGEY